MKRSAKDAEAFAQLSEADRRQILEFLVEKERQASGRPSAKEGNFLERMKAAYAQSEPPPAPVVAVEDEKHVAPLLQLPLWPCEVRGAPNAILRSALFSVVERGARKALKAKELVTIGDVTLSFTGWRLDQSDLDVWLQAIQMASEQGLGRRIECTVYGILKALGRHHGTSGYEWLLSSFDRLQASGVRIETSKALYQGSLVERFGLEKGSSRYVLIMNQELGSLFVDESYTRLHWQTRQALTGDLTKWLHAYVCSHTPDKPHSITVTTLQQLCGSTREVRKFRHDLKKAVQQLIAVEVLTAASDVVKGKQGDWILVATRPRRLRALPSNPR